MPISQLVVLWFQNKFNLNTSLSKVLQEDPSCQIATVLRRYIRKVGVNNIELALASPAIPEIITLQKGMYDVDLILQLQLFNRRRQGL
mgnify:CR=1 FL=1